MTNSEILPIYHGSQTLCLTFLLIYFLRDLHVIFIISSIEFFLMLILDPLGNSFMNFILWLFITNMWIKSTFESKQIENQKQQVIPSLTTSLWHSQDFRKNLWTHDSNVSILQTHLEKTGLSAAMQRTMELARKS